MPRVLIVEDNILICESLTRILHIIDETLEVYATGYAAEGMVYAKENTVDIFLLDIELLDYSGAVLAKQIRDLDRYKLTPIVFVTNDYRLELDAYRNVHCYSFINKPFKKESVMEIIKTLLKCRPDKPVREENKMILKGKGFSISLLQKDILYIEAQNHKLFAMTTKERVQITGHTLGGIMKVLSDEFYRCHKAFVVNTKWIQKVDKKEKLITLLENKDAVPYGDKYKEFLIGMWI